MGRSRDLQGSGVAGALQSLRRSGGISASRSLLLHALSRFGAGGCGSRRQDSVALSRGAGQGGAVEELFDLFDGFLKDKGYLAMGGQIIDASIVSAPKQHNSVTRTFGSREENETIKDGKMPEDWKSKPAKDRQKDKDARWTTKRHERSYFGYKNHIGVDRQHKFVRRYVVSDASVHDNQKFEDVLDTSNTASDVWAKRAKGSVKRSLMEWRAEGDSAYRSDDIEEKLAERGLKSRIHRRAYRNRKLSEAQKAANTTRSKVRARVEHVFDDQKNGMGAELVRTIGIVRARWRQLQTASIRGRGSNNLAVPRP